MKIKIFALVLAALMSVLALASCGEEVKEHSFSDAWETNKTHHWHAHLASCCDEGELKGSLANHVDVDEDGKCDVCEYPVGHDHTYSAKWTYDEESHWKAATCTHKDEKQFFDLHSDKDDNGVCDVCKGHVHNANAAGYCKHEDCGMKVEEVDETDLDVLLNAILVQKYNVNGYNALLNVNVPSNNEDYEVYYSDDNGVDHKYWTSYNRSTVKNISIVFGKDNYVYNKTTTISTVGTKISDTEYSKGYNVSSDTYHNWIQLTGPNNVFGVYSYDGVTLNLDPSEVDKLNGHYYELSDLVDGYGTEEFLYNLYVLSQDENALDFVVIFDEDARKVVFTFNYLRVHATSTSSNAGSGSLTTDSVPADKETIYNVNYYEVVVSFTYAENLAVTELDVACNTYTNDPGMKTMTEFNYSDVSLKYDPDTNTIKFVKYDPTLPGDNNDEKYVETDSPLTVTYTYHVTQTVGPRTAENEHPQSEFVPESFGIFTNEARTTPFENNITMRKGTGKYIYLGDYKPVGTSLDLVPEAVTYQIIDADGKVLDNTDMMKLPLNEEGQPVPVSEDFASFYQYNPNGRHIYVMPKTAGNYTVVIFLQGVELYRITITAI